jgi:5-methylcytosine-specific restriction enzyme subunit McrC
MEAVFEAFVTKYLVRQLPRPLILKCQVRSHHLVHHLGQNGFRLKPDLLIRESSREALVLDVKWKLLTA